MIGAAVKGCQKSSKPIYVSQGHRVSLKTAIEVVVQCSKLSCTSCLPYLCLGGVSNLPYKEEGKQCFLILVTLYKLYTPPPPRQVQSARACKTG